MGRLLQQRNLEHTVRAILHEDRASRVSNNVLYVKVVERYARDQGFELQGKRFETVMMNISSLRLPQYESVTRARRKVVEQHPELSGDEDVERYREERQRMFEEYAKTRS